MTQNQFLSLSVFLLAFLAAGPLCRTLTDAAGGSWAVLQTNIGISAMHMQLLKNDRVIILDRTDFGPSQIALPNGYCRNDPNDFTLKTDCTAHSVEYTVASNSIRPLTIQTNTWCSGGGVMPDGRLFQSGGYNDGDRAVRIFQPCSTCDWQEINPALVNRRWYATNQRLPDGRLIIIGGRGQFNYEFYPKTSAAGAFDLPFLFQTNDPKEEDNLYPFVFLNIDGNLFIFANNRAILFDYVNNVVVEEYPQMPDGSPRNYPSSGSAVLLPLKLAQGTASSAEVLVCGGTPLGSYTSATTGNFVGALDTCGRITITDPFPQWVMETMPTARVMGDMLLLPNGNVLIINGGSAGTAGWDDGRNPVLNPVVYQPDNPIGSRFESQNPSSTPRMYHSTAILLRDGRVLVGGSNPHAYDTFTGVLFPTDLSLEAFSPSYLDRTFTKFRSTIILPVSQGIIGYNQLITIRFRNKHNINGNFVSVSMVAPSFNTHSFSMNQRLLVLGGGNALKVGDLTYEVAVTTPVSGNLAPSGFYLLFVVDQGIPSQGIWVQIQ